MQGSKFKESADYVLSVVRAVCGDQSINNVRLLAVMLMDMGEVLLMHIMFDGYGVWELDWLSLAVMAKCVRLVLGVVVGCVSLAGVEDVGVSNS